MLYSFIAEFAPSREMLNSIQGRLEEAETSEPTRKVATGRRTPKSGARFPSETLYDCSQLGGLNWFRKMKLEALKQCSLPIL